MNTYSETYSSAEFQVVCGQIEKVFELGVSKSARRSISPWTRQLRLNFELDQWCGNFSAVTHEEGNFPSSTSTTTLTTPPFFPLYTLNLYKQLLKVNSSQLVQYGSQSSIRKVRRSRRLCNADKFLRTRRNRRIRELLQVPLPPNNVI